MAAIDGKAAANSIAPHFNHSMDAAHLMMVANACADHGIQSLAVIHDSFGTHAANTDKLGAILRRTFVELYEGDPLGRLRDAVLEQLKDQPELADQLPALPAKGSFDLSQVLGSTYMFA